MSETITPGLVAELRDAIRDLLPYISDPARAVYWGSSMTPNNKEQSPIQDAEKNLDALRRQAEVVARAKRLLLGE